MKRSIIYLCISLFTLGVKAQLVVQSGATFATTGKAIVTLQDANLFNDGTLSVGSTGKFVFNGTGSNIISGNNSTSFDTLEIAKSAGSKLILMKNTGINAAVLCTSGLLDVNSWNLVLQPTAVLKNETEASHVTGVVGGGIRITTTAPNPATNYNPGNLGASITTAQNMGSIQIFRKHVPAVNPGNAAFTGIQRSYVITPGNNTALNATLRFYYLDAELNGKDENTLTLWRSVDGVNWMLAGVDSRNTTLNYVEKNNIASFSSWTLTDAVNVLPVKLLSYAATCTENIPTIKWGVGTEEIGGKYLVERSLDNGNTFVAIATISSVGNGTHNYEYKDINNIPAGNKIFYRIKLISPDANYTYSPIFSGACSEVTMPFSIYPNPAHEATALHISVRQGSAAIVKIYNAAGQTMSQSSCKLSIGNNTIPLNVAQLKAGMYFVQMILEDKTELKGSFIKQ